MQSNMPDRTKWVPLGLAVFSLCSLYFAPRLVLYLGIGVLTCVVLFVALIVFVTRLLFKYYPEHPTPPAEWFLGHARSAGFQQWKSHEAMYKFSQELGSFYRLHILGSPLFVISDPVLVKDLIDKRDTFPDRMPEFNPIGYFAPLGLLALPTNKMWALHRRLISTLFSQKCMRMYQVYIDQLTDALITSWDQQLDAAPREPIDVGYGMIRLTLDVIGDAVIGWKFNAIEDNQEGRDWLRRTEASIRFTQVLTVIPPFLRKYWPGLPGRARAEEALDFFTDTTLPIIKELQANPPAEGARRTFLEMLCAQQDEHGTSMSAVEIKDELGTIMMAGHETTAHTLTYALYFLASDAEWQAKIRSEAALALAGGLDADNLKSLPLVSAVINETLRLIPTVPMWTRYCNSKGRLGEHRIPRRSLIIVNNWAMGRSTELWGEDAMEFNPQRWLDRPETELPPFTYLPFGAGGRICIGKRFALQEATIVLCKLLAHYEFSQPCDPRPELDLCSSITTQPISPVKLLLNRVATGKAQ
eukprot:NODE_649_length_1731_cov_56.534289_g639_i0.p1 GENE.NODE_649_length_1731_cov_56.534289_g639_i0~~NODE_649_length_1731_cov_56.534289_g639_i0.p1  ORF type:complete len:528 (-),score=79.87 NODE_649_length_1731_cov_56.534289_g639_i0:105-1688(-)